MWLLRALPLAHALQTAWQSQILVGRLERDMRKSQGMREALWLTGLSRWAISLFLAFLQ